VDKLTVIQKLKQLAPQLKGFGIVRCALFGSYVRNAATATSDIDLLVQFAPESTSFHNYMDVCDLLEESFGKTVDLITQDSLSPHIGPFILKEAEDVPLSA